MRSVCRRRVVEADSGLATSRDAGRSDDAIVRRRRRLWLAICGEREETERIVEVPIEKAKS